jgi:hypothetical protein
MMMLMMMMMMMLRRLGFQLLYHSFPPSLLGVMWSGQAEAQGFCFPLPVATS